MAQRDYLQRRKTRDAEVARMGLDNLCEMPFTPTEREMEALTEDLPGADVRRTDRRIVDRRWRRLDAPHPVAPKRIDDTFIAAMNRLAAVTDDLISFSLRAEVGQIDRRKREIAASAREVRVGMARQAAVRREIFDRTRKREERFRLAVEKQKMLQTRRAIDERQKALRDEAEQRKRQAQVVREAEELDAKLRRELEEDEEKDIAARRIRSVRQSHSRALERSEKRAALASATGKIQRGLDLLDATAEVAIIRRFTVEDA